jgi:hypothetical protein
LKNIQILWYLLKYIYVSLKIHSYILIYIKIASKYIAIPHYIPLVYVTKPLIYSNMLPYCLETSLFCTSLSCYYTIFQNCHGLIILSKCCCTCHDMFTVIQKWSIFHESHKSYCLIKYLNPNLISWNTINICWTYIHRSQKPLTTFGIYKVSKFNNINWIHNIL